MADSRFMDWRPVKGADGYEVTRNGLIRTTNGASVGLRVPPVGEFMPINEVEFLVDGVIITRRLHEVIKEAFEETTPVAVANVSDYPEEALPEIVEEYPEEQEEEIINEQP